MIKINKKLSLLLGVIAGLLFLSLNFGFAQTTQIPESAENYSGKNLETTLPNPTSPSLSPCPGPEREPRFVYREKVVHEERQFRAEHTGCGGDILMRNWQVVGLEMGRCLGTSANEDCSDPQWTDDFVYFYDRYTPNQEGEVFDEVGSWQKAWPASARWLTEEELEEKYGEPIPFPTCQTDCLQAPPGVPGEVGEFGQEDPYYFNNPWLPGIAGGERPQNISQLRNKNLLGGNNPLKRVDLPVKLFWWNIPGWHEGWIENGEFKKCSDDPKNIACIDSYIIKFDNINREDRPAKFHRYEVVNKLTEEGYEYEEAQDKFEELEIQNRNAYIDYREAHNDTRSLDVMRYDRDNIIGCDNCGTELEIWLETNSFNPLAFKPKYKYDREKRKWMKKYLLEKFEGDNALQGIITDTYNSYGRPAFFRSGTEHTYSLQAACPAHDYLEEDEGRRGPEATFSFETSDAPELISPIDPNWVSPYDAKLYDPNFDASRVQSEKYGYENGYRYPAETSQEIGDNTVASNIDGPLADFLEDPTNPLNVDGRDRTASNGERGPSKNSSEAEDYVEYIATTADYVDTELARKIANAGGTTVIPPERYWQNIIPTAEVVGLVQEQVGSVNVTSSYRPLGYNREIGSSDGSQHVQNTAIDFWSPGTSTQELYDTVIYLRDEENVFSGGVGIYPNSGFVHVDTRGYDADWGERYAMNNQSATMEASENNYLRERTSLKDWRSRLSDTSSIWSEDSYNLVLQDQVSFREELKWAQQWYQPTPDARPEPPRVYLMNFGEGIRVLTETINEYGEPVLEDCHSQLTETVDDNPICNYRRRPVEPDETQHRYPEPNHLDAEMDFFTLPEDEKKDIYSWNIASCRDRAGVNCTDFSQKWRFQLDDRETRRLFPPKNINPPNMNNEEVSEDDATVGFPFRVRWDGRFGARSYVYKIREKGSDSWESIKIQNSRNIYYSTGEFKKLSDIDLGLDNYSSNYGSTFDSLSSNSDSENDIYWTGDLKPDTTYEWDIKACWDDNYYDGDVEKGEEEYVETVENWVDNEDNKRCSAWRSEDYENAPFQFKTAGRPPKSTEIISPTPLSRVTYPVEIDWADVPGAKSYAIIIQKCSSSNSDLNSSLYESLYDFEPVDCSDQEIFISLADIGSLVSDSNFTYYNELSLYDTYQYKIYSCINPIEEKETYYQHEEGSFAKILGLPNIGEMPDKMLETGCHLEKSSNKISFMPKLSPPTNLSPGNKEENSPERIPADDSFQTLTWENVQGAEAYRVEINLLEESSEEEAGIKKAYAQEDNSYPKEIITQETKTRHDFSLPGNYSWTVESCITDDCTSSFNDDEDIRSEKSNINYIQLYTPSFLGFEGVVPCGRNIDIFPENPNLDSRDDCQLMHLFVLIAKIIEEILVKIIIPYSLVILLLYTGYLYYTGLGDPTIMQQVFKLWEYALKGYLLILLSWVIVGTLLTVLGYQFGVWWQITSNL